MPEARRRLLLTLFEYGKMTFRQLQDASQISPRIVNRHLKALIDEKLVHEEGREGWKQGKKLWYSLTKKGRKECLRQSIDDLNGSLKVVQDIVAAILSKPSRIDEFREKNRQELFGTKITELMPLDERVRIVSTEMKSIYGPLNEAYKAMHKLMTQLMTPKAVRDQEFFIGFTKQGAIHMIPRVILERLELEIP